MVRVGAAAEIRVAIEMEDGTGAEVNGEVVAAAAAQCALETPLAEASAAA